MASVRYSGIWFNDVTNSAVFRLDLGNHVARVIGRAVIHDHDFQIGARSHLIPYRIKRARQEVRTIEGTNRDGQKRFHLLDIASGFSSNKSPVSPFTVTECNMRT